MLLVSPRCVGTQLESHIRHIDVDDLRRKQKSNRSRLGHQISRLASHEAEL